MTSCLIIDDSKVVRSIMSRILQRCGFACAEAETGEQAYEMCEREMPSMLMIDEGLPGMSGKQFLRKIKKLNPSPFPVIVFCTADSSLAGIQEALDLGADEYIIKPFDNDILCAKLRILNLLPAGESA